MDGRDTQNIKKLNTKLNTTDGIIEARGTKANRQRCQGAVQFHGTCLVSSNKGFWDIQTARKRWRELSGGNHHQ
jgi:hypothetical protein